MKTKFLVIRLKTIIKYALAVLAAIIAMSAVAVIMSQSKATYSPGTYSGSIILHGNPVSVNVTVDRHSIESIDITDLGETEAVFYPVFEQSFDDISQQVIALQSTEGVSLSDDNAVTGGIILDAINAALQNAKQ